MESTDELENREVIMTDKNALRTSSFTVGAIIFYLLILFLLMIIDSDLLHIENMIIASIPSVIIITFVIFNKIVLWKKFVRLRQRNE